jgi:hypothetical protein
MSILGMVASIRLGQVGAGAGRGVFTRRRAGAKPTEIIIPRGGGRGRGSPRHYRESTGVAQGVWGPGWSERAVCGPIDDARASAPHRSRAVAERRRFYEEASCPSK